MNHPRLFTANRMEILVHALAEVLRTPLSSPLEAEVIVVQSKGMERYLAMHLAQHRGIFGNCRFPFPNVFLDQVFRKVLPDLPEHSSFEPETLVWRVMERLPGHLTQPAFESLRLYLEGEEGVLKRLQLSMAVADTFDQYLVFRPDMIHRWERGEEDHWQAVLWRDLARSGSETHRLASARRFLETIQDLSPEKAGLPERVCVFGISALPRFHMEILSALSGFMEVHLFLMNPCREYWGDILPERTIGRIRERARTGTGKGDLLHLEKGNSLLASTGKLGRDFLDLVTDLGWEEFSSYEDPGRETLLRAIQSDILHLREGAPQDEPTGTFPAGDPSIRFHICHSPMREVEVLKDQLLLFFEEIPGLMPGDVLVMTPDIEVYAPYIQAVFDVPAGEPTWLPFGVADQGIRRLSRVVEPFLTLLDLHHGRFGASEILAFLECDPIGRRFGFSRDDMETVRRWIRATRIRWGMDGRDRESAGLPPFEENTWMAGLDRLLLGYAMPGGNERLFDGILPYDFLEGGETHLLGSLVEFVEALSHVAGELRSPRPLDQWAAFLGRLLERFFDPAGPEEREMNLVRAAARRIGEMTDPRRADFKEDLDAQGIRWFLGKVLEKEGTGYGFLTGGITFCSMLPMRSVPAKVLCLMGMNSDAYPRESHPLGFDLMAGHPRPGDRSRRNDDRYLFLECLLSARERLHISYVGQSVQDNSPVPPSVLVSELMDTIARGYTVPGRAVLEDLTTTHRLQPFSPRYFRGDDRLFSYSPEHREAAASLVAKRKPPTPFFTVGLPEPEEAHRAVDLGELCRFYAHPAKVLLNRRAGLRLEEEIPLPEDKECMEIQGLERYQLGEKMVRQMLGGSDPGRFQALLRAGGELPPGSVGECAYDDLRQGAGRLVESLLPHLQGEAPVALEVDLKLSIYTLRGRLDDLYPAGLVRYRYARIKGADLLRAWIHHLALNGSAPVGVPRITHILGIERGKEGRVECAAFRFTQVEEAEPLLRGLLDRYWKGMVKPLLLFPESSQTYAREVWAKGKDPVDALRRARAVWEGDLYHRGEREDPYHRLCFGCADALGEEFKDVSLEIFGPLLEHLQAG